MQPKPFAGILQDIDTEGTRMLACEAKLGFGAFSKDGLSLKYSIRIKGEGARQYTQQRQCKGVRRRSARYKASK